MDGEIARPERVELWIDTGASTDTEIRADLALEGTTHAEVCWQLDGTVETTGAQIDVRNPSDGDVISFAQFLTAEPATIFFASGACVSGDRMTEAPPAVDPLATEARRPRVWLETDITAEFGTPAQGKKNVATTSLPTCSRTRCLLSSKIT